MKAKIYRVQDQFGRGPWKPGFSHLWVESRQDHESLIPGYVEFPTWMNRAYRWETLGHGCTTKEQLKRWITKSEYESLLNLGYRSVEIEVSRIIDKSGIQCVFAKIGPLFEGAVEFDLYGEVA